MNAVPGAATSGRRSAIASRSPGIIVVQMKARLKPAGKIEQLPDRDPCLARIIAPGRDRLRHAFVQVQQPILRRRQRRQTPKRFRAAVDFSRLIRARRLQSFPILHHEQRGAAVARGISRRRAHRRRIERGSRRKARASPARERKPAADHRISEIWLRAFATAMGQRARPVSSQIEHRSFPGDESNPPPRRRAYGPPAAAQKCVRQPNGRSR